MAITKKQDARDSNTANPFLKLAKDVQNAVLGTGTKPVVPEMRLECMIDENIERPLNANIASLRREINSIDSHERDYALRVNRKSRAALSVVIGAIYGLSAPLAMLLAGSIQSVSGGWLPVAGALLSVGTIAALATCVATYFTILPAMAYEAYRRAEQSRKRFKESADLVMRDARKLAECTERAFPDKRLVVRQRLDKVSDAIDSLIEMNSETLRDREPLIRSMSLSNWLIFSDPEVVRADKHITESIRDYARRHERGINPTDMRFAELTNAVARLKAEASRRVS